MQAKIQKAFNFNYPNRYLLGADFGYRMEEEKRSERDAFLGKFENRVIPDYLAWTYNLEKESFFFIGNTSNFIGIDKLTFAGFMGKIKSCFRSQFLEAVSGYISNLEKNETHSGKTHLAINVLIKLKPEVYYHCKVSLIPFITKNGVTDFVVIVLPIVLPVEDCKGLNFSVEVKVNGNTNNDATREVKKNIIPPAIRLTKKQHMILKGLYNGLVASQIAETTGVGIESIYKINRRILYLVSEYYDIEFTSAKEAADYHFTSSRLLSTGS